MESLTLQTRPANGPFEVPNSTGYQTYSGVLSVLDASGDGVADSLHDAPYTPLSNSGLQGWFGTDADRPHHKVVRDGEDVRYTLHLGIVPPDDRAVFEALVRAFVIEDRTLPLAHGALTVEEVSTEQTTQADLLDAAAAAADEAAGIRLRCRSTTCMQRYDGVWDPHPDRVHLFRQLADRWNAVADDPELEITPTADALGEGLYTVADTDAYDTHSIVVHRREPDGDGDEDDAAADRPEQPVAADGGHLNEAQGFVGEWEFRFKDASQATRTAVLALGAFAEYAGVGRHTARGAGSVETAVIGTDL